MQFAPESESWLPVGHLSHARGFHAMSFSSMDISNHCPSLVKTTTPTPTTASGTTENKAILMVGGKLNKMEIFDTETGEFCTAILELPHRRHGHTIGAYTIQMMINLSLECLLSCRCCCWQESCLWRRLHRSWKNLHLAQW